MQKIEQENLPDSIGRRILIENNIIMECEKHLRYYIIFEGTKEKIEEEIRLQVDLFAIRRKNTFKKFINKEVLVNAMLRVVKDSSSSCQKCDKEKIQEKSE